MRVEIVKNRIAGPPGESDGVRNASVAGPENSPRKAGYFLTSVAL
jgi:hypothetical protein